MRRRPKTRKIINQWRTQFKNRFPRYIDEGAVFMFPATAPADGFYIVVWFPYQYGRPELFLCSCPAYRYNEDDVCKHTMRLKEEINAASPVPREPGQSRTSATASTTFGS